MMVTRPFTTNQSVDKMVKESVSSGDRNTELAVDGFDQDGEREGAMTEVLARSTSAVAQPRHTRRLSDKVLVAFHHACDSSDLEIAEQLLGTLEVMLARRPLHADVNRRRSLEGLVAAHERLWHLRHPALD